ncbi:D-arabinono-1,4-lactone oxidase [Mucilaginibacter lappiensis]|uniref:D-arabinono-1,4-lactone oxidase n=1 Tax=Mucilaginibacter lappiensis TaxID=354630 RepID=A0ABR6PVU0_9SPHI|nr:D-arabinono-1,4-lactone oxidase [Mucilaginibacter lappiensis]MBB6113100.1 D-arabinono-1,4-lactone oxidase [Mucilaginibacter lappiensis]SIS12500.1 D-arabinono-1,4-lactone oxidase [Mucilaginibacter lappiensis]
MDTIIVNGATYWLPESNDDVIALVQEALDKNEIICVRGSGHSFPLIGTTEKEQISSTGRPYKYIMLSKMYAVTMIDANTVKVQAGCHLGHDPFDPTKTSTVDNSLCYILDNLGLALPDLGGITHQTIGGFLSTGSSGGSTQYSFEDALDSIEVVTYMAEGDYAVPYLYEYNISVPQQFHSTGLASMGLMGIIVSATFKCIPQFYIQGSETIEYTDKCSLINLFGPWPSKLPGLQTFLEKTEYTRLMWWPQQNNKQDLSRMVVWQAKRTDKAGAEAWAAHAYDLMGVQPSADGLKPYEEVPYIFSSPDPANVVANLIYNAIGQWPTWLQKLLADKPAEYEIIKTLVESNYATKIFPAIMDIFVAVDTPTNKNKGPQLFSDLWYTGIPMDNQMSDKLMPVWFTELWIDICDTEKVMQALKGYYDVQPITVDLSFSCEIYAAKKSPFWLSPAYNRDVIRIDVFWYGNNQGDPATFYQNFWDLFAPFNYRPHWGKYIPDTVNGMPVATYLSKLYPKWHTWMNLRQQVDSRQIFVTDYWRQKLGIPLV